MSSIDQIDRNLSVSHIGDRPVCWHSVWEPAFCVKGLQIPTDPFEPYTRLPVSVAESVSEGVAFLNYHTSGGRVRFRTDSPYVAIRTHLNRITKMSHFCLCGSCGFDLYTEDDPEDITYIGTFIPPYEVEDSGYESLLSVGDAAHSLLLNFPLYSGVSDLHIGLAPGAVLEVSDFVEAERPVVYYGSSITQGGCASRPGNAYPNMLSRRLKRDFINLGFSGSAKAEEPMVNYIAGLDMAAFVYDYDHNAPTPEFLRKTHEPMFRKIREAQPTLPIVMLPRPRAGKLNWDDQARYDVVRTTYENAVKQGDQHVYFVDAAHVFNRAGGDSCTVDNCHPNDLGFWCMTEGLTDILRHILLDT